MKSKKGKSKRESQQNGVAALLTVVIIGAATLVMAYGASLLGLGELSIGYAEQKGAEAFSLADGCMEEALRRTRLNASYGVGVGTMNVSVTNGSCTIEVTDTGSNPETRNIIVRGTTGRFHKRIQSAFSLSADTPPVITITSWDELGI
jgi:hypothetical protein